MGWAIDTPPCIGFKRLSSNHCLSNALPKLCTFSCDLPFSDSPDPDPAKNLDKINSAIEIFDGNQKRRFFEIV